MKIFNFFIKKQSSKDPQNKIEPAKSGKIEVPSIEQTQFAEAALQILNPTVEKFGFNLHKTEVKKYSSNITWRKESLYLKIQSSNYPTDYPYYYNIIFGEGDSDNIFEYDWNSIALWKFAEKIDCKKEEYKFPIGPEIIPSVEKANSELEKYGITFLNGDLELFHQLRSEENKNREPYQISQFKNGKLITYDDPVSLKQRSKFS